MGAVKEFEAVKDTINELAIGQSPQWMIDVANSLIENAEKIVEDRRDSAIVDYNISEEMKYTDGVINRNYNKMIYEQAVLDSIYDIQDAIKDFKKIG